MSCRANKYTQVCFNHGGSSAPMSCLADSVFLASAAYRQVKSFVDLWMRVVLLLIHSKATSTCYLLIGRELQKR